MYMYRKVYSKTKERAVICSYLGQSVTELFSSYIFFGNINHKDVGVDFLRIDGKNTLSVLVKC